MGAVYLVKHHKLGKTFALKETFFNDDELLRRAFEREAQLLANLDHPALPRVTDHFIEFENQFLLMEYIPGEDLGRQLTARAAPFSVDEVLEWADQLLDALEYLHTHNPPIIHRDIKPANLKVNARSKIILLDFGLAKGATSEMSDPARSVFGFTPNYAPPEQVQGEGTDARSDLYSLAATVYHLLTAVMPPPISARVAAIADGQPDPLRLASEFNHRINKDIALVLMKAMARNRDARPSSAAAMRKALHEARDSLSEDLFELDERALAPTVSDFKETEVGGPLKGVIEEDGDTVPVPPLVSKQLESGNVGERVTALVELGRIGGEDSFLLITKAFDDPSSEVRDAAARALVNFQKDRAAAFTRALREATPARRRRIGSVIATSGLATEAIRDLTGEDRDRTYDAFSILFLMSKAGEVRPLMQAIEGHPNTEVRLAVVKLLGLSGQPGILPAFRRMAVRGSLPPEVRSAIMEAIYQMTKESESE